MMLGGIEFAEGWHGIPSEGRAVGWLGSRVMPLSSPFRSGRDHGSIHERASQMREGGSFLWDHASNCLPWLNPARTAFKRSGTVFGLTTNATAPAAIAFLRLDAVPFPE